MNHNLNFIKYCLGYLRLTRKRTFTSQHKFSVNLPHEYFSLINFLTQKAEDAGEAIRLESFYGTDPKKVSKDTEPQYKHEKEIAKKLEDIYNEYRNEQFTKQIILKFGHVEIELAIEPEKDIDFESNNEQHIQKRIDRYPLFELAANIEKSKNGTYFIRAIDSTIQINIGMLETILGENLYFQLLDEMGKYENNQDLTLPISDVNIFTDIWHNIKTKLRLRNACFDENSFMFNDIKIDLCPRAHYFLTEDLIKLSKLPEDWVNHTALTSWTKNDELNIQDNIPYEKDLYFPFRYDKSQLATLSILGNKAAIIQGPPGTGKSETISNILCHLAATGKRVLFVSQKAQALKVVKDKLKSLKIKYLFGYLPNLNSAQLGDTDEADAIAPQLSALGAYIETLVQQSRIKKTQITEIVEEKAELCKKHNDAIDLQKQYYTLDNERKKLEEYDGCNVTNIECFAKHFSSESYKEIKNVLETISKLKTELTQINENKIKRNDLNKFSFGLNTSGQKYSNILQKIEEQILTKAIEIEKIQADIAKLSDKIQQYESSKKKLKLDSVFSKLNPQQLTYTDEIRIIKDDLIKTAYDGHYQILRKANNIARRARLRHIFANLPRELRNYIHDFISKDVSRLQVNEFIEAVFEYFCYFDDKQAIKNKENSIISALSLQFKSFENDLSPKINRWIETNLCVSNAPLEQILFRLTELINYFIYREKELELSCSEKKLNDLLGICGLSSNTFSWLDQKINTLGIMHLEKIKTNILHMQDVKSRLEKLKKSTNSLDFDYETIKFIEEKRKKHVGLYIQNILNQNILNKWRDISIKQIVRKLASVFGKSKKAFRTFDNLRKDSSNFKAILELIPVWIMELDDASRIIPLEANLFDYVIFDEASQCNIAYALPVMYRTNKVLFVGDSEQMRDSTVLFKSNRDFDELASRYQIPEERQIKYTGSTIQSVLDMAYKRGFMDKSLRYHYRSPGELIGFSNKYFYKPKGKELLTVNSNYLTYKDTNRIMLVHQVKSDWTDEISDNINVAEARAILALFKEMRNDACYKGKSIGILTFLNSQATYIRTLFENNGFKEELDNYKVSIIDGIQGDEKDIIMYSFVIRHQDQKNKYIPLIGEDGDIRADINKGRVNVAFSRAKLQAHCFTSLSIEEMPEKIWLKKYLEYAIENGEVSFCSTDIKQFDSYFEEEFFRLASAHLKAGFKIQNQVESCGFKIDFVITNTTNGKQIAIECDGPCHFQDEVDEAIGINIESDEERQRILESAGWRFFRIKYSDWINITFNRDTIIQTIIDLLR
jgi:superfamily I DNA and/or RNA helicase/very-short-patch-repair endonuclease